jgi:tetratricopeptide (TPR) repeat protein
MRRLGWVVVVAGGLVGAAWSNAFGGLTVGGGWFERDSYEEAIRYFSRIIHSGDASKQELGSAFYNRGNAFYELGSFDLAIKDYSRALSLDPNDVDAYYNRGNIFFDLGDTGRAIEDYSAAIRLQPEHDFAYFNRGNCYLRQGRVEQAAADYRKAYSLKPDDPVYQEMLKELELLQ